jgi:hypothetical protein
MSPEDPGLLGNLPRSRPGHRSEKRRAPAPPPRSRKQPQEPERSDDAVGDSLRAAAKGVGAGLRVANGVTREVLRRLPRP